MAPKKTTIRDIALELDLSVSAVSKALNGYPDINKATRLRVIEAAKRLNYTPNQQALSLIKKRTNLIGLVIPELNHYFFSYLAESMIKLAAHDHITVIVKTSFENVEQEKKVLRELTERNVDGILISLSDETRAPDHLIEIYNNGTPIVEFDKISKLSPFDKVVNGDRDAAKKAVQHLINRGKRTIAHLRGSLLSQNAVDRFLGYKTTLEETGLKYDESLVVTVPPNNLQQAQQAFATMFKKRPDIDAVFAITDIAAIGVLEELKKQSVAVPDQVAVVGFSNWQVSKLVTPRLTTVDQNTFEMAKVSYELLSENIKEKTKPTNRQKKTVYIQTELIIRESS